MNNLNNRVFSVFLRSFLGVIFIFSGLSKLFPIHLTELNLVYHHIADWTFSPYITRALIIIEILLGLALILGVYFNRITIYVGMLITVIFSIYLIVQLITGGNSQNCGCFGTILPMTPMASLVKNIFIVLLFMLLLNILNIKNSKVNVILFLFSSITAVTLVLYLFPIYTWLKVNPIPKETVPFDFNKPIAFQHGKTLNLNKGKKLIGVFNMACNNCREVAYKVGIVAKQNKLDNLYLMLVGEEDEIVDFLQETHLNYPYKRYTFFEFLKRYPHSTWPWIILSNEGIIEKQWIYETFDVKNFIKQIN